MRVTANGVTVPNPESGVKILVELDGDETIKGPCGIYTKGGCLTIDGRGSGEACFTLETDPETAKVRPSLVLLHDTKLTVSDNADNPLYLSHALDRPVSNGATGE